jgi:hypothetical protein
MGIANGTLKYDVGQNTRIVGGDANETNGVRDDPGCIGTANSQNGALVKESANGGNSRSATAPENVFAGCDCPRWGKDFVLPTARATFEEKGYRLHANYNIN